MYRVSCDTAMLGPASLLRLRPFVTSHSTLVTSAFHRPHQLAAIASASAVGLRGTAVARYGARSSDSWPGLLAWRAADVDERIVWGDKSAVKVAKECTQPEDLGESLARCAQQVLSTADPRQKACLTHQAWHAYKRGRLTIGAASPPDQPSRPSKPELVPPKQIPSMKFSPLPTNVYMLHNLAHIELNAIDLAWDTVARFSQLGLPEDFYTDFARVADDEARHLSWCLQRMEELGYDYGCMPAHNLLWEGAEMSADDLFARLAIVPMSQEARGLDAGKRLAEKLVGWGDNRTAAIVHQIALEERNHVAVGVTWFQTICDAMGVDPGPAFRSLLLELCPDLLKGPFNHEERDVAGLCRSWYDTSTWPKEQQEASLLLQKKPEKHAQQSQVASTTSNSASLGGPADHTPSITVDNPASHGSTSSVIAACSSRPAAIPPNSIQMNEEQLIELKQRLAALLEIELRASA